MEGEMPEPRTTPREHDVPVFQPGRPTPEDPRKESPMKDPPVNPEHDGDVDNDPPVRQAQTQESEPREIGGIDDPDASGGRVLYDENRVPG
jgi:hypothetical protein